jgi:hypothetical protein
MFASERKAKVLFTKDRGLIASRIMEKEPLTKLTWRGHETVEAVPPLLDHAEQIEIDLPAGYNHSLFRLLHPDAPPVQLEETDVSGGPQLLANIASIKGLEELSKLIGPLTTARATVQVCSPPKIVITLPGARINAK